jgi:hypothetical protein
MAMRLPVVDFGELVPPPGQTEVNFRKSSNVQLDYLLNGTVERNCLLGHLN